MLAPLYSLSYDGRMANIIRCACDCLRECIIANSLVSAVLLLMADLMMTKGGRICGVID